MEYLNIYLYKDVNTIIEGYIENKNELFYLTRQWKLIGNPYNFALQNKYNDLLEWTKTIKYGDLSIHWAEKCSKQCMSGNIETINYYYNNGSRFQWNCSDLLKYNYDRENIIELLDHLRKNLECHIGYIEKCKCENKCENKIHEKVRKWFSKESKRHLQVKQFIYEPCQTFEGYCNCFLRNYFDNNFDNIHPSPSDNIYGSYIAFICNNSKEDVITPKEIIKLSIKYGELYKGVFKNMPTM